MKGIVFNLLEEVVSRRYGDDTWDQLLDAAGLDGAYTSLGNYPDAQLFALVAAASTALDVPAHAVVRWFGREAIPLMAQKYPVFFDRHTQTRPFLTTLNSIIHPEVRKLYPGADVPDFVMDSSSPDLLRMDYMSARKLCAFAEGLIEGAAAHFGERVSITHDRCMHRGDLQCQLELTFERAPLDA
ncbi:MAG: heme NO-binding domain-containing protein [Acidobacteria bacterium]|nr:heme NO-binding domain-containing protein [Acidobacteriota bacterium]